MHSYYVLHKYVYSVYAACSVVCACNSCIGRDKGTRDIFQYKLRDDLTMNYNNEFETIFIEIDDNMHNMLIGEKDRVSGTSAQLSIQRYQSLLHIVSAFNGDVMIGSDQNFNYANIENHEPTRNLLDSFISSGFIPTITKPTRITHNTSTLIDNLYIKIKQPGELICGILNIDISDHLPIFTFIGTQKCTKKAPKYIVCRPMDEEKVIHINNDLNNIDWAIIDNLDIDDAYDLMVSKIRNALNSHAPEKTIKISYIRTFLDSLDDLSIAKIIPN